MFKEVPSAGALMFWGLLYVLLSLQLCMHLTCIMRRHANAPTGDVVTRFQAIVTLFLALMAVQFVVNADLPASSYALPTQQFIIVRVCVCFNKGKGGHCTPCHVLGLSRWFHSLAHHFLPS